MRMSIPKGLITPPVETEKKSNLKKIKFSANIALGGSYPLEKKTKVQYSQRASFIGSIKEEEPKEEDFVLENMQFKRIEQKDFRLDKENVVESSRTKFQIIVIVFSQGKKLEAGDQPPTGCAKKT